jgi:F-type H+-transporting ATPase subunit epsilon
MAENKMRLQIITPSRAVLDETVDSVILKTVTGDMGVLYDHEPVVSLLTYGVLRYKQDGIEKKATIMSGFAEITKDKVMILTDSSELQNEIDVPRAEASKQRAESRMNKQEFDRQRAEIALKKALIRINLASGQK